MARTAPPLEKRSSRPIAPKSPVAATAKTPSLPRRDIFESIWTLFCSVRFAAVQILVLATATTLGTLVPQLPPGVRNFPLDYSDFMAKAQLRFGPITDTLNWAGFFDLYNTFWYRLLIVVLCYSIIVCTLNRWGPIWKLINPTTARSSEGFLLGLSEHAQFSGVPLSTEHATQAISGVLKRGRYRLISQPTESGAIYVYGDRDRWSKMVTFVSHAALVMLIITAAGMTQIGWREQSVFFAPDTAVNVGHGTDFSVKQTDFRVEYYPGSSTNVKEYWATMGVIRDGQEVMTKTIRVNDPLRYEDINFFLVSYVEGAKVQAVDSANNVLSLNAMGANGPVTDTVATLDPMFLSFQMSSDDGLPMDLVQLRRQGQETVTLQIERYSDMQRAPDENPALFVRAYIGQDFNNTYYNDFIPRTGPLVIPEVPGASFSFGGNSAVVMEVAEDHGLTFMAMWFLIMSGGFALSLFVTFTRCWAIIKPNAADPRRSDIVLAGLAEKNKVSYEADFEKTAIRVRDALTKYTTRNA